MARTPAASRPGGPSAPPAPGVEEIERSAEFRRLTAGRRRFTLVAAGLFYAWFAAFLVLAGWAHDWMATRIYKGLTVGYLLGVGVIVAVWAVVFAYSRVSARHFDALADRAQERGQP